MALKIRLRQQGRTNRAFYRMVVTDSRSPRDGKYVEALGWYNPIEADLEKMLHLDEERIKYWLGVGAQLSERTKSLISKVAPKVIQDQTKKELAHRSKVAKQRKTKKAAA